MPCASWGQEGRMETQDTIKIKKWKLGMKTNEDENDIESFKKYKEIKNQEKITLRTATWGYQSE